ncbi:Fc.00g093980.m01.CDS01 [Cosmosporella sp. VM-42]
MATAGQQSVHMMLELLPPHIVRLDDWKGVTEQADRRRVQNRINQRAARKRKRASARNDLPNSAQRGPKPSRNQLTSIITTGPKVDASSALFKIQDPSLWQLFHSAMESVPADRSKLINFAQNIALHSADMQRALRSFEKWMYFLTGSPKRDCLFTLIQFNVFRAMVTNERHGTGNADTVTADAIAEKDHPSSMDRSTAVTEDAGQLATCRG